MDKNEKIKVAITSGVVAAILLILVLFLALSGNKGNKNESVQSNVSESAVINSSNEQAGNFDSIEGEASSSGSSLVANIDASIVNNSSEENSGNNTNNSSTVTSKVVKNDVSGNSFYSTNASTLKDVYKGLAIDIEAQLFEMYTYWNNGNEDAVRDLAHLERFEAMSYKLTGTNNFYYYGETNASGEPDGIGLAVYAGDQYYYGHWSGGKRNGSGTWVNYYPEYNNYVVTEHMYSGEWADDLPTGEGQEHFDYDQDKMNVDDIYLQNAIGTFNKGLFDGSMYVLTIDYNGNVEEWYGDCSEGTWLQVVNTHVDENGKIPVLKKANVDKEYIYMTEKGTKNQSIKGIIASGSIAN